MPPISVLNAGEIILNISPLSTSLAQRPKRKAMTMASTDKHKVTLIIKVTQKVSRSRVFSILTSYKFVKFVAKHLYLNCRLPCALII